MRKRDIIFSKLDKVIDKIITFILWFLLWVSGSIGGFYSAYTPQGQSLLVKYKAYDISSELYLVVVILHLMTCLYLALYLIRDLTNAR